MAEPPRRAPLDDEDPPRAADRDPLGDEARRFGASACRQIGQFWMKRL
jgi:hypothetical protein